MPPSNENTQAVMAENIYSILGKIERCGQWRDCEVEYG